MNRDSGLTEKAQEQISQYDSKLKGKGPWLYEDGSQPQATGQMVQTPTPKAKSVEERSRCFGNYGIGCYSTE